MMEPIWGGRNGGISKILEEGAPLSKVWDKNQEVENVAAIPTSTRNVMLKAVTSVPYSGANIEEIKIMEIDISSGNLPLQGTNPLVNMATKRSRGESMMRQATMPAALQPKPMYMVGGALGYGKYETMTYLLGSAVYGRAYFSDAGINKQFALSIWDCLLSRAIHLYHHTVDGNNKLNL